MQKWKTAISTRKGEEFFVRGKKLLDVIEKSTFTQGIFLLLKGSLPSQKEEALLNAALLAMIEHGVEAPSAFVSRTVASTGNPVNAALAAGILSIGEYHGGAIEQCVFYFQSGKNAKKIVAEVMAKGQRMPGFGHKIYKDKDPRAQLLLKKAGELGFDGKSIKLAREVETELARATNKHLPLNIDGAVAALLCELGFDWRMGKAIFILGRLPGLIAHVNEELANEKPYRRLDESDVEYTGPPIA